MCCESLNQRQSEQAVEVRSRTLEFERCDWLLENAFALLSTL